MCDDVMVASILEMLLTICISGGSLEKQNQEEIDRR